MNLAILLLYGLFTTLSSARPSLIERASCTISAGGETLKGIVTAGGACRYSIRYAHAERWGYSSIATDLKNQTTTALPPACPQDSGSYVDGASQSEDCLFVVVYTPPTATFTSGLPVLVWVHGGSYVAGSASAPGLDGSRLAVKGNMIVIVGQYRLGVLGYLPPTSASSSADPNLGLLDVINGLQAVQKYVSFFGGDKSKVTIGGQSSGGGIILGLFGAPAAKGLFRAAILQSDPMSYSFQSQTLRSELRDSYYSQAPLSGCKTLACLQAIPISPILAAQDNLTSNAPKFTGVALAEPIRPTYGTASLPYDPMNSIFNSPSSLAIAPSSLPLLLTTVKNEGGSVTESIFPSPVPVSNSTFDATIQGLFGTDRANAIITSPYYILKPDSSPNSDEFREVFERLVTDGTWRCANRDAARHWVAAGGKVWMGEFRQGATYPDNQVNGGYCEVPGRVCHEDDIYPTLQTEPNPSANTTAFEDEIATYSISFITTLNPNPGKSKRDGSCPQESRQLHSRSAVAAWKQYTSTSTTGEVLSLGGDGEVSSCPPTEFWGGTVKYDWQLYG